MRKPVVQGALLLAMLVSSGWAQAEDAASTATIDTEVQLKNGETKRGTLVSVEPGKHVIVLVGDEQTVIPWTDVAKIVAGPQEPAPSAAAAAQTPAATTTQAPTSPTKGMPYVHVESNWEDVELQRIDGELGAGIYGAKDQVGPQTLSKYICQAPCDKLVDGRDGHRFFFTGPGMYPSQPFRLEQHDGNVTARVHGVGLGRLIGGVLLTTTGGMLSLSGTMLFAFSFAADEPTASNPKPAETARDVRTAGLVVGGIGAGMLVGGIFMLAGGRTRVDIIKTPRGETALSWDRGAFRF